MNIYESHGGTPAEVERSVHVLHGHTCMNPEILSIPGYLGHPTFLQTTQTHGSQGTKYPRIASTFIQTTQTHGSQDT